MARTPMAVTPTPTVAALRAVIDLDVVGPVISRHIYGHFAEHLGRPDSFVPQHLGEHPRRQSSDFYHQRSRVRYGVTPV
jgi:hypothetical protein